jgi:hypothetical protein
MMSLALLVSIIFLNVLLLGPLALLFSRLGFKKIGATIGVFAMIAGAYWICLAPFPISLIGGISLICGGLALNKI